MNLPRELVLGRLLRQFGHFDWLEERLRIWRVVTNLFLGTLLLRLYLRTICLQVGARGLDASQSELLLTLALFLWELPRHFGLGRLHWRRFIPKEVRNDLTLLLRVVRVVVLEVDRVADLGLRRVLAFLLFRCVQTVLEILLGQLHRSELDLELLNLFQ